MRKVKPVGRPTEYKEKYCQMIIDFFANHELQRERVKTSGLDITTTELVTNPYPTINDFAKKIDVNYVSLRRWVETHPEFSDAYKRAKELQHEIIIKGALIGAYNATFSIFAMKNIAGWRDKTEVEHSGSIELSTKLEEAWKRLQASQN